MLNLFLTVCLFISSILWISEGKFYKTNYCTNLFFRLRIVIGKWSIAIKTKIYGGLGLYRARNVNIYMLWKYIWELLHHPTKLWVQLLLHEYLINSHILDEVIYHSVSFTWKYISKASSLGDIFIEIKFLIDPLIFYLYFLFNWLTYIKVTIMSKFHKLNQTKDGINN